MVEQNQNFPPGVPRFSPVAGGRAAIEKMQQSHQTLFGPGGQLPGVGQGPQFTFKDMELASRAAKSFQFLTEDVRKNLEDTEHGMTDMGTALAENAKIAMQ